MSKPIPRLVHGVLDYGYAAAIAASPEIFGFKDQKTAKLLCRVLGIAIFATSLCTRYELGLIRVLPFKLHLGADVAAGIFSLGAPWIFKFSANKRAHHNFVEFGMLALIVALLTRPDEMK